MMLSCKINVSILKINELLIMYIQNNIQFYQTPYSVGRCTKCGGLLWGQPQTSGDFYCNCLPEPILKGWECPKCRKIHSPYVYECDCSPRFQISN